MNSRGERTAAKTQGRGDPDPRTLVGGGDSGREREREREREEGEAREKGVEGRQRRMGEREGRKRGVAQIWCLGGVGVRCPRRGGLVQWRRHGGMGGHPDRCLALGPSSTMAKTQRGGGHMNISYRTPCEGQCISNLTRCKYVASSTQN
ncbi:hypothetical protein TIFTF001_021787 [Ficus carica]|uniref:Uncharacterized protein n=1 Tax=Ficus carica TaxID=3494 RepID=A0AA88AI45_FICCA|nr:hypothetical protein TIFTF001_021787 [Ficus carica]